MDARNKHGDAAGTRALIEVLLLHRRMPHEAVLAGIIATLNADPVPVEEAAAAVLQVLSGTAAG